MKLLEYEAKALLSRYDVPVPYGTVIHKGNQPVFNAPMVLKSQVPTGGRGKAGGIIAITPTDDIQAVCDRLFGLAIKNHMPHTLLAEEQLSISRELYLCLLINRDTAQYQLLAHTSGGIEVETNDSQDFLRLSMTADSLSSCAGTLAEYFEIEPKSISTLLTHLFTAFTQSDATLLEINPLVVTKTGRLVCADAKIALDDGARFRHPDWSFEAASHDANFVVLDHNGTVASIANGAGLAMATVDAVAAKGMSPANFLDIGGGANTQTVLTAFSRIMAFKNVQAIVVNIFAGITRCDEVAKAIIEAKQQIPSLPPLFIRLAGTHFEDAVALLATHNIATMASLEDCLTAADEATHA